MSWTLDFDLVSFILENSCSQQKCSQMQPQSSSHYPPVQGNAWSGEYASSKNLHDSTSTSKGEVKSLKSSLYSILLNNLSLLRCQCLRCQCLRCQCLRCHGYLGSDKRRATEASDWSLLISAAYQHPRIEL